MGKEIYHLFADDGVKDEYGFPKLHFRTSQINLNSDWGSLLSFLKNNGRIENMEPVYRVPDELKSINGLRDLTVTEIEKWEAELKEKGDLLEKKL